MAFSGLSRDKASSCLNPHASLPNLRTWRAMSPLTKIMTNSMTDPRIQSTKPFHKPPLQLPPSALVMTSLVSISIVISSCPLLSPRLLPLANSAAVYPPPGPSGNLVRSHSILFSDS